VSVMLAVAGLVTEGIMGSNLLECEILEISTLAVDHLEWLFQLLLENNSVRIAYIRTVQNVIHVPQVPIIRISMFLHSIRWTAQPIESSVFPSKLSYTSWPSRLPQRSFASS